MLENNKLNAEIQEKVLNNMELYREAYDNAPEYLQDIIMESYQNFTKNKGKLIYTKELRMEIRKNEYEDIDESGSYKRVKMKKMNSRGEEGDIYESEHLLCDGCYKRFLGKKLGLFQGSWSKNYDS